MYCETKEKDVASQHVDTVNNDINSTQLIIEKFNEMAPEYTDRLQSIWKRMGFSRNSQRDRVEAVTKYIEELLSDMVYDEENLLNDLTQNIDKYEVELSNLADILGLPTYKVDENLALIEKEKNLRDKFDLWNLVKHERKESLKNLRLKEKGLCDRLALPPHDTSIFEIPTETELKEIEANILYMEKELTQAKLQFKRLRENILKLWEELEIDGDNTKYVDIIHDHAEENYVLSRNNLLQLKEYIMKLGQQQDEDHELAIKLTKQLKSLWTHLEIHQKEQNAFKEKCIGFRPSSIQMLKDEVKKYESMKMKYTEKFIHSLRKELTHLWDKCFFGEDERNEFAPAFDDNYTEELMNIHEHQIQVLHGFYEDNKAIFKLVEKREAMWRKLMEFENQENDPTRLFTNRGGALLKELKMKNSVEKGLPKVEKELRKLIEVWQKENETFFSVNGEKYLELIQVQQENRKREKKMAKLGKQKEKKEALVKEMIYGTKPAVRVSRQNNAGNTSKRKHEDKNGSWTFSTSSTSNMTSSQRRDHTPMTARIKKKVRNKRRISSKIVKIPMTLRTFRSKENIHKHISREDEEEDEDEDKSDSVQITTDESMESVCTYPDFTNHLRHGGVRELSSTAASIEHSHGDDPSTSSVI